MRTIVVIVAAAVAGLTGALRAATSPSPEIVTLQQAAEGGDAAAKFQLGRAYYRGTSVAKDDQKALSLIREAAEVGDADAIDTMGYFYSEGELVEVDENKAVEWFRRGVKAGSARSKLNLGLMLRQGKTIQSMPAESLKLMEEAASDGLPEAKSYLGQLYFNGDRHMQPDRHKAFPYIKESAEAGDPVCQNLMGVFFRDGLGVVEDFSSTSKEAKEWFQKAAIQNDLKAQSNLAHIMGVGSPACENRQEALKWLIIAKDRGEITAKKTYDELFNTLPSAAVVAARLEANRFSVLKQAEADARKKNVREAGTGTAFPR